MKWHHLVMYYGSVVVILAALLTLSYGYYLYFFDANPPVVWLDEPHDVVVVDGGSAIIVSVELCKYTRVPAEITRCYVDGIEYCAPVVSTNLPVGCYNMSRYIDVPKSLPSGTYHLVSTGVYRVNPLVSRTASTYTKNFTINRQK